MQRKLRPIPNSIKNLYGVIAVLLVIIPELIARFILIFSSRDSKYQFHKENSILKTNPGLFIEKMNIYELRILAKELQIYGYSNENSLILKRRILKKLSQQSHRLN